MECLYSDYTGHNTGKMLPLRAVLLLLILGGLSVWGQKNKKNQKPENPIANIKSVANFDIKKFSGKWYLLSVASRCNYLKTDNHRVEATLVQVSDAKDFRRRQYLAMSIFREEEGICWEIKNAYYPELKNVQGRYIIKGKGYLRNVNMVVGDTDYQTYAILYYQLRDEISLKLYGRKPDLSNDIYRKFDDLVIKQGMTREEIYSFPSYGFCEKADRFHILNEVPK